MDSTDENSIDMLADDELERLVEIIIEQHGLSLGRRCFTNEVMMLFEDIAGLESMTQKQAGQYADALWRRYHQRSRSPDHSAHRN